MSLLASKFNVDSTQEECHFLAFKALIAHSLVIMKHIYFSCKAALFLYFQFILFPSSTEDDVIIRLNSVQC